ncbi:hypothetical protein FRC07_002725, partial [Ceratobasidium sp. 392]
PPGCWSDDHKVTLEWLGISLPFLALPVPEPVLTLPAPARLLTLPAPARILTLPAPAPVLALPAPPPVLTLPAPARVLALPAPALVLTLPAPAPVLTLPAPAQVLTLSAPPLVLTLPAPARILTLPASAPVLTLPAPPPSLDVSRFKGQLVVRFLRFEWRNIASGACILALTLLPHFLARLLCGGRNRYRMTANSFPVEDTQPAELLAVPAKCELGYTDPFDGLDLNIVWIPPTRGHLGGLAPDLFRLAGNSLEADWIDTSVKLQDDNMDAAVQELSQAQVITTMDDPVDDRREVVDSLDGNNHPLDGPLENRLDELLDSDTQPGAPNLEKLEVLPKNDIMDLPVVATEAVDDQEGWTVVQSRSRRRRPPPVEAPSTSSGRRQGNREVHNRGGSRGGRNGKKGAEKQGGRNGGRNGGNGGGGGANGQVGGGWTDNGNRSNGSPGADNWRRRSGGGHNEGGRSEGGAQRPPADIAFQRRLHRRSAAANN